MAPRFSTLSLAIAVATAFLAGSAAAAEPKDMTQAQSAASKDVDNSKVNSRDKHDATTLPTDQPNNSADLKVAAAVRAAIVDDESLSMTAHNVKLVAAGGTVVLRGPVESAAEKAKVGQLAGSIAGVSKVENHLEVKSP